MKTEFPLNALASGSSIKGSSKKSSRSTSSSKTLPTYDLKDLSPSFKISTKSGTWASSILSVLEPLELVTSDKESGLLPTPTTTEIQETPEQWAVRSSQPSKKSCGPSLTVKVQIMQELGQVSNTEARKHYKTLPTPTTFDSGAPLPPRKKNPSGGQKPPLVSVLCSDKSQRLNPQFVEAMMGFPKDWTKVDDSE